MKNNPNQEIHTDYKANDVFKPVNANKLAEVIPYDFIITQEQFDAYIATNPPKESVPIDVGNIIAADIDGNIRTFPTVKAPCSLYIAANTKGYSLSFCSRLIGISTGNIIDMSDFTDNQQYTIELTRDALNVYSAYPYKVYQLGGGINFWSTRQAYVILDNISTTWPGVCRVGAYKLNSSSDLGSFNTGLQMVFGSPLDMVSNIPDISPDSSLATSPNYVPPVIFADWTGESKGNCEYYLLNGTTSKPALFQQIFISRINYGNDVSILVADFHGYTTYRLSSINTIVSSAVFTNTELNKTLTVESDGNLIYKDIYHGGAGGGTSSVIFTNYKVSDCITPDYIEGTRQDASGQPASSLSGLINTIGESRTVYRPGTVAFKTIAEDTGYSGADWYSTGGPSNAPAFEFRGATTLEMYTWLCICCFNTSSKVFDWKTAEPLYLDAESLVEGTVYEVNIHVMQLPLKMYQPLNSSGVVAGIQHVPGTPMKEIEDYCKTRWSNAIVVSHTSQYTVYFYNNSTGESCNNVKYWGSGNDVAATNSPFIVHPSFTRYDTVFDSNVESFSNAFTELGYASLRFVKLSGYIYIMKY